MNAATEHTPYELIGGEPAVRRLVDGFYDRMVTSTAAKELREMHARDLGPMREKLFDFLSGWLGGPPRYFERADRQCMTSVHAHYVIGARERDQWLECMRLALNALEAPEDTVRLIDAAFVHVAEALRNA